MPAKPKHHPEQDPGESATLETHPAENGVISVSIRGDWSSEQTQPQVSDWESEVCRENVSAVTFDTESLGRWNSRLLVILLRIQEVCDEKKIECKTDTLRPELAGLLKLAKAAPAGDEAGRKRDTPPGMLARVGISWLKRWGEWSGLVRFVGENLIALLRLLRGRAQFRWSDMLLVMQQCGPQALGIVALINFLVGLILAFVGAVELKRFGATLYVADLVAVATVREMASIMTGIVLCGRTGAAFAAQLGTMKVNQELDAFSTFGVSIMEFLVLPRMLALVLMMPLLCLFADLISITGGFCVTWATLHVTPVLYLDRTLSAITLASFLLGVIKGGIFGILVALTGCYRGMECGTNAAAVGEATTRAVVTGITAIIATDGIFAVLCNALNI